MKGKNTLVFNQATMQAAIAYYLNNVVLNKDKPVVVTDVSSQSVNGHYKDFKIEIESSEDVPLGATQ